MRSIMMVVVALSFFLAIPALAAVGYTCTCEGITKMRSGTSVKITLCGMGGAGGYHGQVHECMTRDEMNRYLGHINTNSLIDRPVGGELYNPYFGWRCKKVDTCD